MRIKRISLVLAFFGLSFGLVLGQGDKAIVVGTVTDATGGVIPGAEVTLTRVETNEALMALTTDTGDFAFPGLVSGIYNLRVSMPGFKTDERTGMKLDLGRTYRLDAVLNVGEVSEVISVESTAPILKTEEPELGQVISNQKLMNLPLNSRDVFVLATLTPGVIFTRNTTGRGSSYSVKGMRRTDNVVTIDGSLVSETNAGLEFRTNPDAVQEFEIKTGLYGAQYGMKPGGHFSLITKSGTNELHGSAFWFHRNDNLDARNFFDVGPRPEFKRNQFGAVIGGPIVLPGLLDGRDKAWWFFAYGGERIRRATTQTGNVPTAAERDGIFSDTIMDPLTGEPFPNNTIPRERFDQVSQKLIGLYPPANTDPSRGFNYSLPSPSPRDTNEIIARIDFKTSEDSRWSGRFLYNDAPHLVVRPIPIFSRTDTLTNYAQNLTNTRSIGGNVVNEFGFHFYRRPYFPGLIAANSPVDFSNNLGIKNWPVRDPDFEGVPVVNVTGLVNMGDSGNKGGVPEGNWEVKDNVSLTKGSHLMKFGYHYRLQYLGFYFRNRSGFTYTSDRYTGNAFGNMLLGHLSEAGLGSEYRLNTHQPGHFFYFQDNWKVTPKLTLNLGLRYELRLPWHDKRGFLSNLRYDCALAALPASPIPGCYDPGVAIADPVFPATGRFEKEKALWSWTKSGYQPRLGLSYRLTDETVIRAGTGIYGNEPIGGKVYGGLGGSRNPRANAARRVFTASKDFPDLPQSDPFSAFTPGGGLPLAGAFESPLPQWYVPNWGLALQHRLTDNAMVEVGYQGSRSVHEIQIREVNDADLGTAPRQERRPFPMLQSYQYMEASGDQYYNALEFKLEKRPGPEGLTALVAYTWAKSIDTTGPRGGVAGDPRSITRNRTIRENRGPGEANIPGRLATMLGYEIPIGRGYRYGSDNVLGKVLGGWSFYTILVLQKGSFITPIINADYHDVGSRSTVRPDVSGNPNLDSGSRRPERWFDSSVYSLPPLDRYGNAGRGTIETPGVQNVDLSLLRNFDLSESVKMEFRFEAFNLLNHASFNIPQNNFLSSSFGVVGSALEGRDLQFGLKFYF